jgi:hypothetical protein
MASSKPEASGDDGPDARQRGAEAGDLVGDAEEEEEQRADDDGERPARVRVERRAGPLVERVGGVGVARALGAERVAGEREEAHRRREDDDAAPGQDFDPVATQIDRARQGRFDRASFLDVGLILGFAHVGALFDFEHAWAFLSVGWHRLPDSRVLGLSLAQR